MNLSLDSNNGRSLRRWFVCLAALAALVLAGCAEGNASAAAPASAGPKYVATTTPDTIVTLKTNQGIIKLRLFPDVAPKACDNFVGLIQKGYYDRTIFHRIIADFMIQGGDPTGTGGGGDSIWGGNFANEVRPDVKFDAKGKLGMANSGPDTNRSQFFITTAPYPSLNMHYTLFGEVVSGQDVVDRIGHTITDMNDRPMVVQYIIQATVGKE